MWQQQAWATAHNSPSFTSSKIFCHYPFTLEYLRVGPTWMWQQHALATAHNSPSFTNSKIFWYYPLTLEYLRVSPTRMWQQQAWATGHSPQHSFFFYQLWSKDLLAVSLYCILEYLRVGPTWKWQQHGVLSCSPPANHSAGYPGTRSLSLNMWKYSLQTQCN